MNTCLNHSQKQLNSALFLSFSLKLHTSAKLISLLANGIFSSIAYQFLQHSWRMIRLYMDQFVFYYFSFLSLLLPCQGRTRWVRRWRSCRRAGPCRSRPCRRRWAAACPASSGLSRESLKVIKHETLLPKSYFLGPKRPLELSLFVYSTVSLSACLLVFYKRKWIKNRWKSQLSKKNNNNNNPQQLQPC